MQTVYYLTIGGLVLRLAAEPWLWRTGHPGA
jgi:hypothetical protein